jgi:hypothetical protein
MNPFHPNACLTCPEFWFQLIYGVATDTSVNPSTDIISFPRLPCPCLQCPGLVRHDCWPVSCLHRIHMCTQLIAEHPDPDGCARQTLFASAYAMLDSTSWVGQLVLPSLPFSLLPNLQWIILMKYSHIRTLCTLLGLRLGDRCALLNISIGPYLICIIFTCTCNLLWAQHENNAITLLYTNCLWLKHHDDPISILNFYTVCMPFT